MSNVTLTTPVAPVVFTLPPPPADGESAWHQIAALVESSVRGATLPVTTDAQHAGETVARVVKETRADPVLYGNLKKLAAAGLFDLGTLERLTLHAPALWYARHRQLVEELAPGHAVAPAVVEDAGSLCQRMGRVVRYNLEDHPEEGHLARSVTHTQSRRGLANNLLVAAGLYERNEAMLRGDRHHRADDAARARALAAEIQGALGGNGGTRWSQRCAVVWTTLKRDYDELRAAARWLLRARPDDAKARFPSLLEANGHRRKAEPTNEAREEPAAPVDPADPVAPADATKPADPAAPVDVAKPAEPVAPEEAATPRKPLVRKPRATAAAPTKKAARGR